MQYFNRWNPPSENTVIIAADKPTIEDEEMDLINFYQIKLPHLVIHLQQWVMLVHLWLII